MVLQLIRNKDGNYEYKDAMETSAPNITSSEFESYTGDTKTTLAGGTDLGTQTATLMRETPGETELITDPVTGETKAQSKVQPVNIEQQQFAPPSAQDLVESPLQKAARLAQQFPMQQQTGPSPQEFLGQIQSMQDKALKAERINTLLKGGVDLGISYLNLGRTGGAMNIQQTVTPLTSLTATPVGASTLGGVAGAGAAAYGIGSAFKVKEKKGMAAGASIGMAVGGPVGAVIGAVGGGIVESVFGGGTVICTELYKQNLMSKEDHRLSWNFTINNFSDTHINGYWYWAVPMVKLMKKNKLVTKFWNHVMSNRTKDIKWRLKKGKFNLLGRLYSMLIENGSYVVGKLIFKKHKEVLV